jgi:hypothetical protein
MKVRKSLATAMIAGQLLVVLGLGGTPVSTAGRAALEAQARAAVSEFFQTINAKQFGRTCDLMSVRFFRQNRIPDRKRCVLGLSVGFANQTVVFRVLGVRLQGEAAIVRTLANGAPGKIVFVRESGALKILRLDAS